MAAFQWTFAGHGQNHVLTRTSDQSHLASQTFNVDVKAVKAALLAQEDTDKDGRITVNDAGRRNFALRAAGLSRDFNIAGTYHLANLLQELALAEIAKHDNVTIPGNRIVENPVDRIQRRISEHMWKSLHRELTGPTIVAVAKDPKDIDKNARPRIYVSSTAHKQYEYYSNVAKQYPESKLEVVVLPPGFPNHTNPWDLSQPNGILALHIDEDGTGLTPTPYTVPGHRFNEFYGWDSYFCALGLLEIGIVDMPMNIARHFIFEIEHYGSILNANRSYYLGRSHPPFLTDLVLRTHGRLRETGDKAANEFLRAGILAAIKEYHTVWTAEPRYEPTTGLSRYHATQHGIPPEVEPGHFDWFLKAHAEKLGISTAELSRLYNLGELDTGVSAELDTFFVHDGSIRESGHDTSYRLEGQCADLVTVDLNSLLYKYEQDIARALGDNSIEWHSSATSEGITSEMLQPSYWLERAANRQERVNKYLWDPSDGMFHDYNTVSQQQTPYKSVTTFWTLWSGLASPEKAETMITRVIHDFENVGGVTSTIPQPHEPSGPEHRQRQWDHPFGWAPHQMTLWDALRRYGYVDEARRLAYKWLYLITRIVVDYNGTITEKYDVTRLGIDESVQAEYGNQGVEFQGVPLEGFGWTNASYSYGLAVLDERLREKLRAGYRWEEIEDE